VAGLGKFASLVSESGADCVTRPRYALGPS
jgi:hypothetical protein